MFTIKLQLKSHRNSHVFHPGCLLPLFLPPNAGMGAEWTTNFICLTFISAMVRYQLLRAKRSTSTKVFTGKNGSCGAIFRSKGPWKMIWVTFCCFLQEMRQICFLQSPPCARASSPVLSSPQPILPRTFPVLVSCKLAPAFRHGPCQNGQVSGSVVIATLRACHHPKTWFVALHFRKRARRKNGYLSKEVRVFKEDSLNSFLGCLFVLDHSMTGSLLWFH